MAYEDMIYGDAFSSGLVGGGFAAVAIFFIVLAFLFSIALYIYVSLVYMRIAKKGNYHTPAFAWIPFVGPGLISANLAKMHWWPLLLLIIIWIPVIGFLASLVLAVFFIIWTWKIFEGFGKPGWWAVLFIIPAIGFIIGLVLLSIVAFGKDKFDAKKVK